MRFEIVPIALSLQHMASVYRHTSSLYSRFSVVMSVHEALAAGMGAAGFGGIISLPVQKRQMPSSMSLALVRSAQAW
jgi:hypothetical protein